MADKIFENNQVSIMGEIVSDFRFSHEVYGEGFYMVDVAVNRLSNYLDYIPLMISERLIDVNADYIGQIIYVTGVSGGTAGGYEEQPDFSGRIYLQGTDLPEDAAGTGDCGSSDRRQPFLRKIRLYSMHLLG